MIKFQHGKRYMQVSVKELQFKISHVANYKLQGLTYYCTTLRLDCQMLKATMETCSSSTPYYQQARWQQFTKMLPLLKNAKLLPKWPIVHNKNTLKIFMKLKEFNVISSLDPTKPIVRVRSSPLQNLSLRKSGSQQRKQPPMLKR